MKITLNIPDNMQLDLIKLGSKLEVPVEKVVVTVMGAGTAVLEGHALQPSYFVNGRLLRAAQLYDACKAAGKECRLVVSGGDSQSHGEAEATVYGRALAALGIPAAIIISAGFSELGAEGKALEDIAKPLSVISRLFTTIFWFGADREGIDDIAGSAPIPGQRYGEHDDFAANWLDDDSVA